MTRTKRLRSFLPDVFAHGWVKNGGDRLRIHVAFNKTDVDLRAMSNQVCCALARHRRCETSAGHIIICTFFAPWNWRAATSTAREFVSHMCRESSNDDRSILYLAVCLFLFSNVFWLFASGIWSRFLNQHFLFLLSIAKTTERQNLSFSQYPSVLTRASGSPSDVRLINVDLFRWHEWLHTVSGSQMIYFDGIFQW